MSSESTSKRLSAGDYVAAAIVTSGGLGYAKVAPGTWGTLGGVALALAATALPGLEPLAWLVILAAICFALGVALGGWCERHFGAKDAQQVVIDEVVGYLITVIFFVAVHGKNPSFAGYCVAFVLFRAFDIGKPWPGRQVERLPRGWGVMMDDAVLALYSGALFAILGGSAWL